MLPCIAVGHNFPDCFHLKRSYMCENCKEELEGILLHDSLDILRTPLLEKVEETERVDRES